MSTPWNGMSREEFMRPVREGGMSMGEGRVLEPPQHGTLYEGCPNSQHESGQHRFVCYANLNSVEFFRCSYGCGAEFSD